jgi:hypothetical protein
MGIPLLATDGMIIRELRATFSSASRATASAETTQSNFAQVAAITPYSE